MDRINIFEGTNYKVRAKKMERWARKGRPGLAFVILIFLPILPSFLSPFFPKTIDEVMTFLIEHKINALRLPFSLEFALTPMDVTEEEAGGGQGKLQYPDREKISLEYYG